MLSSGEIGDHDLFVLVGESDHTFLHEIHKQFIPVNEVGKFSEGHVRDRHTIVLAGDHPAVNAAATLVPVIGVCCVTDLFFFPRCKVYANRAPGAGTLIASVQLVIYITGGCED